MSYYKKYRKNQKELKCLLENDSNIGEKNKIPVQSKEFCVPLKELQESTIKNISLFHECFRGSDRRKFIHR